MVNTINYSYYPTNSCAVYTLPYREEYLPNYVNTYNTMSITSNPTFNLMSLNEYNAYGLYSIYLNQAIKAIENDSFDYFDLLETIRGLDKYNDFLTVCIQKNDELINKSILTYLTTKDFALISANEENFVVKKLVDSSSCIIQEYALETILSWDALSFNNYSNIKNVVINNYYLQNDLTKFLEEKTGGISSSTN